VLERAGLFLRQHDHAPSSFSESLEHGDSHPGEYHWRARSRHRSPSAPVAGTADNNE
jgi:hypothetical protein